MVRSLLLSLLGVVLLRVAVSLWAPLALEYVQVVVFLAVVALLMWRGRAVLPRAITVCALLGGIAGACYAYSLVRSHANDGEVVYVLRLQGDETGGASRILREAIDGRDRSLTRRMYQELEVTRRLREDLARVFDNARDESGVVWGGTNLVRYSPSPKVPVQVKVVAHSSRIGAAPVVSSRLGELSIVVDIPVIGMSYQPVNATGAFIRLLTKAQRASGEEREILLEAAGRISDRWRSSEHKAYPFFLIGTDLLRRYFAGGAIEPALLECSLRDFQSALTFLKTGGNTQLLAGVRNNLAIARAALLEAQGLPLTDVRSDLALAGRLAGRKDPFGLGGPTPKIAQDNLQLLFPAQRGRASAHTTAAPSQPSRPHRKRRSAHHG